MWHSPIELAGALHARIRAVEVMAFDFDGVFTDNTVYVSQDGVEMVRSSRFDGIGLSALRAIGVHPVIISTEVNPVVRARSAKLQIDCINACGDKVAALQGILDERGLSFEQAGFLGNDVNDLSVLKRVGLPIVVADAHPAILTVAAYRCTRPGGHGAVREVCDMIVDLKEK